MFPHYIINSTQLIGTRTLLSWGNLFVAHMKSINDHFDPGHRIDHVMRVTLTALKLAMHENAKLEIVLPAVILHDTQPVSKFAENRHSASALSAANSIRLLQEWEYPSEFLHSIQHAILAHSFSARIAAETLEAKVIQDADRLDALGSTGIARTMAVGFSHGNPLYNFDEPFPINRKADDHANILDHFYEKLLRLPETLHTEAAKHEAKIRIKRMEIFLQGLAEEIGVEYISYESYCDHQQPITRKAEIA